MNETIHRIEIDGEGGTGRVEIAGLPIGADAQAIIDGSQALWWWWNGGGNDGGGETTAHAG